MLKNILIVVIFIAALVVSKSCTTLSSVGITVPDEPFEKLSDYGFFDGDISQLIPVDGVLPYDLNSPLFSDYSHKLRFVWMPEGKSVGYNTDHVMDWPVGAVLIKNFYYQHDERELDMGRRLIETRLLINRGDEWDAYGYTWNDEQTEAVYDIIGDIKDVKWINKDGELMKVDYIIPNKNQCKGCHSYENKIKPIGPKARNLNKEYAYTDGTMNQLQKWSQSGYLTEYGLQTKVPSVAVWDDSESYSTHERAMAYLDINCGHCHNPDGAGYTSGLTLLSSTEPGIKLGIYKATVSAGAGTGGHHFSIVPGNPDESIMVYRMNSDNPGAMMPELGRRLVHQEGVELISEWIREMKDETI